MTHSHQYTIQLLWTGAEHGPTVSYERYSREYEYRAAGKPRVRGSADPHFRGDPSLYNPEELLVAALSSCHLLSYLAECARDGISVLTYEDDACGVMAVKDRRLRFTEVVLHPRVVIAPGNDLARARELHHVAHDLCFIANSVDFDVRNEPSVSY